MLLQPAPSIHTAFMKFDIDVVFMDGTLRVLKVIEGLPPWRAASARHAWGVLELAAGEIEHRQLKVGDQLGVVEITSELGAVDPDGGFQAGGWTSVANGGSRRKRSRDPVAHANPGLNSSDLPTDAVRVLVVGSDRRFRSVAAALLTRRGVAVTLRDQMTEVAELTEREQAQVVVLDAGSSLTAAAYEAAQIEKLDPPVGVVVVGDVPEEGLTAMPVLAKWGSFDGLFDAIEGSRRSRGTKVTIPGNHQPI